MPAETLQKIGDALTPVTAGDIPAPWLMAYRRRPLSLLAIAT
jgi:hypothetical protein